MTNKWRGQVQKITDSKLMAQVWPYIGQYQDTPVSRMANFAIGSLYGAGVKPSELTSRASSILRANPGDARDIAKASIAAVQFLGDTFNNYLGSLQPEDFERHAANGKEPSELVLEALQSSEKKYNGGIVYPETLDLLEKAGVLSKADFFKFANLQADCDKRVAGLVMELENAEDPLERADIRDRMVDINCDSVGMILCAFVHMFRPNPAISGKDDVSMDDLRELYPMQMEIGRTWQYSYGTLACGNRMTREFDGSSKGEPDPVIAELERQGEYTPELMEQMQRIADSKPGLKSVPAEQLPGPMQKALRTVAERATERIREIPNAGGVRKAIYSAITGMNARVMCGQGIRDYSASARPQNGAAR